MRFGRSKKEDDSFKMSSTQDQIEELARALDASNNTVAISGAGISLAAGGVTYSGMASRSGGGNMMSRDPQARYDAFYRSFLSSMFEHGPTFAHEALAELEAEGKLQGIITTNVDCMHTMAGSKNVAEIQGSFQTNVCTECGEWTYGYEIWNEGKMPSCPHCGGMLMPYNIYSHASLLDSEVGHAQKLMQDADLILVIGASGCYAQVYWYNRKHNSKVIQINPGNTIFDRYAYLNIREGSDPVFEQVMAIRNDRHAPEEEQEALTGAEGADEE